MNLLKPKFIKIAKKSPQKITEKIVKTKQLPNTDQLETSNPNINTTIEGISDENFDKSLVKQNSYKTMLTVKHDQSELTQQQQQQLTPNQVREFLMATQTSENPMDDTINNLAKIERIVLKQTFLEQQNMFDPIKYFGGLDIKDLNVKQKDQRLSDMFKSSKEAPAKTNANRDPRPELLMSQQEGGGGGCGNNSQIMWQNQLNKIYIKGSKVQEQEPQNCLFQQSHSLSNDRKPSPSFKQCENTLQTAKSSNAILSPKSMSALSPSQKNHGQSYLKNSKNYPANNNNNDTAQQPQHQQNPFFFSFQGIPSTIQSIEQHKLEKFEQEYMNSESTLRKKELEKFLMKARIGVEEQAKTVAAVAGTQLEMTFQIEEKLKQSIQSQRKSLENALANQIQQPMLCPEQVIQDSMFHENIDFIQQNQTFDENLNPKPQYTYKGNGLLKCNSTANFCQAGSNHTPLGNQQQFSSIANETFNNNTKKGKSHSQYDFKQLQKQNQEGESQGKSTNTSNQKKSKMTSYGNNHNNNSSQNQGNKALYMGQGINNKRSKSRNNSQFQSANAAQAFTHYQQQHNQDSSGKRSHRVKSSMVYKKQQNMLINTSNRQEDAQIMNSYLSPTSKKSSNSNNNISVLAINNTFMKSRMNQDKEVVTHHLKKPSFKGNNFYNQTNSNANAKCRSPSNSPLHKVSSTVSIHNLCAAQSSRERDMQPQQYQANKENLHQPGLPNNSGCQKYSVISNGKGKYQIDSKYNSSLAHLLQLKAQYDDTRNLQQPSFILQKKN